MGIRKTSEIPSEFLPDDSTEEPMVFKYDIIETYS